MGPLGQALINGVVATMIVALIFLIVSYPSAERLGISVGVGVLAAILTWLRVSRL